MEVTPDSGAAKAQLQVDDVIVAVDGQAITDIGQVRRWVQSHQPGDTIKLTIQRSGNQIDVTVTLGAVPANLGAATLPANEVGTSPAATAAATQ
jgi:S1-C subfamily serine protease